MINATVEARRPDGARDSISATFNAVGSGVVMSPGKYPGSLVEAFNVIF